MFLYDCRKISIEQVTVCETETQTMNLKLIIKFFIDNNKYAEYVSILFR